MLLISDIKSTFQYTETLQDMKHVRGSHLG